MQRDHASSLIRTHVTIGSQCAQNGTPESRHGPIDLVTTVGSTPTIYQKSLRLVNTTRLEGIDLFTMPTDERYMSHPYLALAVELDCGVLYKERGRIDEVIL